MATSTIWIIVAVVAAVLILGALVWAGRSRRNHQLHGQAEKIRGEVEQESAKVARREALADETAAKARAAKAEAEVKAAEAARLEQRAGEHRSSVEASRDDLDERRAHADQIDPRVKVDKNGNAVDDTAFAETTADDGFVHQNDVHDTAAVDDTAYRNPTAAAEPQTVRPAHRAET